MMEIMLYIIGGLIVGLVMGWLAASRRELGRMGQLAGELAATKERAAQLDQQLITREQKIELLNQELANGQEQIGRLAQQIQDQQKDLEEQKKILDDAQQKLQDAFKTLATDALKVSKEEFLQLAIQSFEGMLNQA